MRVKYTLIFLLSMLIYQLSVMLKTAMLSRHVSQLQSEKTKPLAF